MTMLRPIAPGGELARGPERSRPVHARRLVHTDLELHGVHHELGLDLETGRCDGEALHQSAGARLVARQHVLDALTEGPAQKAPEDAIAQQVTGAEGRLVDGAAGHVHEVVALRHELHQLRCQRRVVGSVHRRRGCSSRRRHRRTCAAPRCPCPAPGRCARWLRRRRPAVRWHRSSCCRRRRSRRRPTPRRIP